MILDSTIVRLRGRVQTVWIQDDLLLRLGQRKVKISPFDASRLEVLRTFRAGCEYSHLKDAAWLRPLFTAGFWEEVPQATDDPDHARFDRLLNYLSELEVDGEDRFEALGRLRNSRVAIVGLGGLASWTVFNLLCCAVGKLTLIDGDVVEMSNLNRTILYSEADVGRPKVDAASRAIQSFNPRTVVQAVRMTVASADDLMPVLEDTDVLVGLADQPPWLIKEWVATAGHRLAIPVLQASGSRVGPFQRRAGEACAVCDWTHLSERQPRYGEMFAKQARLPRGDSGALSPLGAMTGGFVANEVIRQLLGQNPLTTNRRWELAGDFTATFNHCPPHPGCGLCQPNGAAAALPSEGLVL